MRKRIKMIFAVITAVLIAVNAFWYVYFIIQGNIHPTLMTWIMFLVTVSLSLWTYRSTKNNNIFDNVCNTVDLFAVILTLIFIILFDKRVRFSLNAVEVFCILFSILILFFWRITKRHELSNILLQIIMVVAYFPMFYQLWNATEPTESLINWSISVAFSLFGVLTGIIAKNRLAILYSLRALILGLIVIILILRL